MNLMALFFVVCFSSMNVLAQQFSAHVTVHIEEDVIALHCLGLEFADARVEEQISPDGAKRYRPIVCLENGFVTVVSLQDGIEDLKAHGYDVRNIRRVPDELASRTATTLLDTIPYQFGWPRQIFNGNSLYENSPTVADVDRNGQLDVSVTNAWGSYPSNPPYLIVWKRNGTYVPGFPAPLQLGQIQSSADAGISAMGDIFGDNKLEVVCGDENGFLYAFNYNGTPLPGFPVSYGSGIGVYVPALADIDNDGKCEVAVISHQWDSPYGNALLHLLKMTTTGPVEMPGFPIDIVRGASNGPAIGDLDGDGQMEIVVCTGGASDGSVLSKVIAYTSAGQVKPGFPWVVGRNSVGCNPTLYDIDRDGTLEILVRVKPDSNVNGIYAIRSNGTLASGFPFPITYGNPNACVAVGDMTGDEIPELAYGGVEAVDSGKVWVFDLTGTLLPGFPARVYRTWVDGSVAIADIDGDGSGDVVCGTNGVSNKPGVICAFNHLGQMITGFPLSPGNPTLNSFTCHPTLVDIDGDGDTEIFAGRVDKLVYGWTTSGIFDSSKAWSTFKGNASRTGGQLRSPFLVGVKDPDTTPFEFMLFQNYPNPFNPSTTIRFSLPVSGQAILVIYDVLGREVETLVNARMETGVYTVTWAPNRYSSGVYMYRLISGAMVETKRMILLK